MARFKSIIRIAKHLASRASAGSCWLALAAVYVYTAAPLFAANVVSTWNGTTNNWASSNWLNVPSVPQFPNNGNGGFTYDAIINSGSVTLNQNITIQKLTLSNGTITGPMNLTALEPLAWSGGKMAGSGTTTVAGGTISGGVKFLESRTLALAGNVNWTNGTILRSSPAAPRGTVVVKSGATFTASGGSPGFNLELDAHLHVESGGKFLNTSPVATLIAHEVAHGPGGVLINNGVVETAANTHLSIPGGSGNGSFIVRNNAVLVALLTDTSDFDFTGSIILDNGIFDAFAWNGGNLQFVLPSYLTGTGTIYADTLVNTREIAPEALQLTGNYEQAPQGRLTVEVDGSGPGQFGRFTVTGSAALGGTLRIDATNYATSSPGATMKVLPAGSLSGTFDSVETIGNNNIYFVDIYDYASGDVSIMQLDRGDMNGDRLIDSLDVDLFVFALMSGSEFKFLQKAAALCDAHERVCELPSSQAGGDWSGSGSVDFNDIPYFRQVAQDNGLGSNAFEAAVDRYLAATTVPEPSTGMLMLCCCALLFDRCASRGWITLGCRRL